MTDYQKILEADIAQAEKYVEQKQQTVNDFAEKYKKEKEHLEALQNNLANLKTKQKDLLEFQEWRTAKNAQEEQVSESSEDTAPKRGTRTKE